MLFYKGLCPTTVRLGQRSAASAHRARPLRARLRIQPQVGKDLLDHRPLQDGGDDLELPGAAAS
jgi:hypothetical protein